MAALGAQIVDKGSHLEVTGCAGAFQQPSVALDCGNSGSTMRMLSGLIAAHPHTFTLIGDESLTVRPMERIRKPLSAMGARLEPDRGTRADHGSWRSVEGHRLRHADPERAGEDGCALRRIAGGGERLHSPRACGRAITPSMRWRAFGATLTRENDRLSIAGGQKSQGHRCDRSG